MKDVLKVVLAIIIVVIVWKIFKGLIGLAIGVALAGAVVYGVMKLVDGGAEAPQMTVVGILIAVVLAFLSFKLVKGVIKFGVIALIAVAVIYFLMKGGGF